MVPMKRTMIKTDLDNLVSELDSVYSLYGYTSGVSFDNNTLTVDVGANQYSRAIAQDCWTLIADTADGTFNVELIEGGEAGFIEANVFPLPL